LTLAAKLAEEAPATYRFFCRAVLPFQHAEGDVHMRCLAPVFRLHPLSGEVIGIRWNETDRAPINTLAYDEVEEFYRHVRVLQASLDELELAVRLAPGDAILCDNHRVLHGRHAFVGHRRLLGCYIQADDWRSRLRVLEAAMGESK